MSGPGLIAIHVSGPVIGAVIGFVGVMGGLMISGDRAERQRRRELHARALAAVLAYTEMPFMIRRRRVEDEQRSAERVRLSDHFSAVKAEISTCQVLLAADGDERLSAAYNELIDVVRATAGHEARIAWCDPPIASDAEMNMGRLFERLEEFRIRLAAFEVDLAQATLPRRRRFWRGLISSDVEYAEAQARANRDGE